MKIFTSIMLLALAGFPLSAQTIAADSVETRRDSLAAKVVAAKRDSLVRAVRDSLAEVGRDTLVAKAERKPTFQGGDINKFRNWVMRQIVYPPTAAQNGITGRVVLGFIVEKDGSIGNIKVLSNVDKLLADEAIRVLKRAPKWEPGIHEGVLARAKYTLPIDFILTRQGQLAGVRHIIGTQIFGA